MKIAVISDIHGNIEALEAVENDIKENNIDKLFVLGDYAMAGPEPEKTVEKFIQKQNDSNVFMIQGNTDLMLATYNDDLYEFLKTKAPVMADALKNDVQTLSDNAKSFLKNLPAQKEVEFEGVKFLLVHGSPRKNNEDILPNLPEDMLNEIVLGVTADVVLCGHTHIPCGYQTKNKISVVNTGSVGRPFTENPQACYLIITLENGKYVFEHRFVDYNKELASEKLRSRNFAGANKLAATLLDPKERHF